MCAQLLSDKRVCVCVHNWSLTRDYLFVQNGLAEAPQNKSRKQIKERKNRTKKIRGVKKNAGNERIAFAFRITLPALLLP